MRYLVVLFAVAVWAPAVFGQVRETHPPPQSPVDSLNAIRVRDDCRVELVAAEPMVKDPIYLDWGPDGKLWVVEMADYNDRKPGGRIRFLEDSDGDGSYDRSTVFLDGLQNPTGVMPWRDGVLVSAAPEIFLARDTDGDGQADQRELLYRGFGEGNQQHRVNGFAWGLDNWLYVANGDSGGEIESMQTRVKLEINGRDLRIRPDSGAMEAQTGQTQFGRRRDDWGNWFSCSNPVALRHLVLADHYLRRNPHFAPPLVRRDIARSDNTQVFPLAEVISHWSGYQPPGAGDSHRFTSAAGISIYRDDLFGPEFNQNSFVCEPIHNLVHRRILSPTGVTFSSRRPSDEEQREFLASTDSWFRPTTVRTGPDGALWITDMYRVAIEHADYMSDEQKQQRDVLLAGHNRGRIYRVLPAEKQARPIPHLSEMTTVNLVAALDSPNGWQRDTAQRLLIHRADPNCVPHLIKSLKSDRSLTRLHALCTLDGLDALPVSDLISALGDSHPGVRRHAVRLCETRLTDAPPLVVALAKMVSDDSPHVRMQLAYTLGESRDAIAAQALTKLMLAHTEEPYLVAAAMSSLGTHNLAEILTPLLNAETTDRPALAPIQIQALEIAAAYGESHALTGALRATLQQGDSSAAGLRKLGQLIRIARQHHLSLANTPAEASRLRRTSQHLRQIALDENTDLEQRVAILELFGWLPAETVGDRTEFIGQFLLASNEPRLQRAAISALGKVEEDDVAEVSLAIWSRLSPGLRSEFVDIILTRHAWTAAFIAGLETKAITSADLSPSHQQRLLLHESADIQSRARKIFAGSVHPDRVALLAKYSAALLRQGNMSHGKKLFVKHCAACHQVNQVGYAVGPDLLAVKNRSPLAILTAVLDPNRTIEDKYRSYVLTTHAGQTFAGIVSSETSTNVSLAAQGGKQHVVLRRDIATLVGSSVSLMPEGLEQDLPAAEMNDLVTYVANLQPPPKRFAGNEPKEITANSDGLLRLPAAACRIYGSSLTFESRYRNLGYWASKDDRAVWLVRVPKPADYEVLLDFSCAPDSANSTFLLSAGSEILTGNVNSTESWDEYREAVIGIVHLDAGSMEVAFQSQGQPTNFLIDLRAIILRPVP